jgi:hypothetical protein
MILLPRAAAFITRPNYFADVLSLCLDAAQKVNSVAQCSHLYSSTLWSLELLEEWQGTAKRLAVVSRLAVLRAEPVLTRVIAARTLFVD